MPPVVTSRSRFALPLNVYAKADEVNWSDWTDRLEVRFGAAKALVPLLLKMTFSVVVPEADVWATPPVHELWLVPQALLVPFQVKNVWAETLGRAAISARVAATAAGRRKKLPVGATAGDGREDTRGEEGVARGCMTIGDNTYELPKANQKIIRIS